MMLKTIKLAIDEQKGRAQMASERGGLQAYTGDAEVIPVPAELSSEEREIVRTLFVELTESVRGDRSRAAAMTLDAAPSMPTVPPVFGDEAASTMQRSMPPLAAETTPPVPPPPIDPLAM